MNVAWAALLAIVVGWGAPSAVPGPALGMREAQLTDTVYVDARTPEEWQEGHVEGAIHIPHDQMESRWRELEQYRDRPIVVYCRTGRRSALAIDVLRDRGFPNLQNGGAFLELVERGVPAVVPARH